MLGLTDKDFKTNVTTMLTDTQEDMLTKNDKQEIAEKLKLYNKTKHKFQN